MSFNLNSHGCAVETRSKNRDSLCLWSPDRHRKASASWSALGLHVSVKVDSSVPLDPLMVTVHLEDSEQIPFNTPGHGIVVFYIYCTTNITTM